MWNDESATPKTVIEGRVIDTTRVIAVSCAESIVNVRYTEMNNVVHEMFPASGSDGTRAQSNFSDVTYWGDPIADLSDFSGDDV